ncbi:MAG: peptidoglycan-binding protein [Patescibacteria group bacterium]
MTLTHSLTRIASAVVAISLVAGIAFAVVAPRAEAAALTQTQISAIISLLQSFGADATTVANVTASLNGTTPSVPSTPSSCSFTRDLTLGATGADVTSLQQALIAAGFSIPAGATGYFGAQTQAAVAAWQKAAGITPTAGYFGPKSRAAFPCSSTTNPTTPSVGTGLSVMAGSQPANGLAPANASRVPFTRVVLTAGTDGDVTISGINVERTGGANNAAFAGVVLVDEATGNQVGTSKTFNSNNQSVVGTTMVIPRGTSKTFLIAGNMQGAATAALYAGQTPAIMVTGVQTTATVSGSLPIVGAYHTINSTLNIGTFVMQTSNAYSVNSTTTKEIGTTAYRFSGFSLTAGSAEDVLLKSISFNQTGSVSLNGDLANVKIGVDGTLYDAMVSTDGKYVWATFGSGITVPKGSKVEVYVQADIVGSNTNARTVQFHIDKNTDIFAMGKTFGYGVNVTGGSSGTPFFYGNTVTIQGASVTTIGKATSVPAQNIAVNVLNQPLGGFVVDLKGEALTVQQMVFTVASSSGSGTGLLTNVTIVDQNGSVVAGPVDATYTSALVQTLTFTDSVTFKTGLGTYTLRGKVASGIGNGTIYTVTTVPSSGWTNVKGDLTGNSVTLTQGTFNMNQMTVKAASLVGLVAATPVAQNQVAGAQDIVFATFQFDASNSGEDLRLSSVGASFGTPANLTSCRLYDGTTNLTTGSNSISAPGATGTFLLDNPLTITKGSVKTLNAVCNIISGAAGNSNVGLQLPSTGLSVTGLGSGNTVTASGSATAGQTMTIAAGSLVVSLDSSSPAIALAASQAQGVTQGIFKLRATNDDVNLSKFGLSLATSSATNGINDISTVTLWANNVQVGSGFFTATVQQIQLNSPLLLPKDTDVLLTVKNNVPAIGTSQPGRPGQLVAVAWNNNAVNNQFTGVGSGVDIVGTGTATSSGVRIFKSVPVVARIALPSTSNLVNGTQDLFRFSVKADAAGSVSLAQISVNTTGTGVTYTALTGKVIVYTDSGFSNTIGGGFTNGEASTTISFTSGVDRAIDFSAPVVIPANTTYYFKVIADIAGVDTAGDSISSKLNGDAAPSYTDVETYALADADAQDDFIWSGNTTGDSAVGTADWFNGYQVVGLPSSDTDSSTNTRAN